MPDRPRLSPAEEFGRRAIGRYQTRNLEELQRLMDDNGIEEEREEFERVFVRELQKRAAPIVNTAVIDVSSDLEDAAAPPGEEEETAPEFKEHEKIQVPARSDVVPDAFTIDLPSGLHVDDPDDGMSINFTPEGNCNAFMYECDDGRLFLILNGMAFLFEPKPFGPDHDPEQLFEIVPVTRVEGPEATEAVCLPCANVVGHMQLKTCPELEQYRALQRRRVYKEPLPFVPPQSATGGGRLNAMKKKSTRADLEESD
jgi:hypothetical protein